MRGQPAPSSIQVLISHYFVSGNLLTPITHIGCILCSFWRTARPHIKVTPASNAVHVKRLTPSATQHGIMSVNTSTSRLNYKSIVCKNKIQLNSSRKKIRNRSYQNAFAFGIPNNQEVALFDSFLSIEVNNRKKGRLIKRKLEKCIYIRDTAYKKRHILINVRIISKCIKCTFLARCP